MNEKNLNYKVKGFRLSEETFKILSSHKKELSWNLFFNELIKRYDKRGFNFSKGDIQKNGHKKGEND